MITYKERVKDRHVYVLSKGIEVIAAFGSKKGLIESDQWPSELPGYPTISRIKAYPIDMKGYRISKVRRY